jgi:hypothetical protein
MNLKGRRLAEAQRFAAFLAREELLAAGKKAAKRCFMWPGLA